MLDRTRFGVFNYPGFQAVQDAHIEHYLPPPATEIIIEKRPQGYNAKFKIQKDELDKWFDQHWERRGLDSVNSRKTLNDGKEMNGTLFEQHLAI